MQKSLVPNAGTVSFAGWTKPVAEPEIAVHMGKDLASGADRSATIAAIAALGPAIELADLNPPPDDVEVALAGNIFHRHVILGPPDPGRAGAKLDGLVGHIFRRGALAAKQENVEALIGEMIGIVQHVAGTLAAHGEKLAPAMLINRLYRPPPFIEPDETEFAYLEPERASVNSAGNQRQFRKLTLPLRVLPSANNRQKRQLGAGIDTHIAASALAYCSRIARRNAQGSIKIGVILPYSGQFADTATQIDNGIKLYMKQNGDSVAGKKIEIIRKDVGGIAPDVAKRLAQELVVRDNVDILAGFVLTPNALAACAVSEEAKKLMVIMNAATSIITTKSPYCTRTSLTLPMVTETLGAWASKNGVKKSYTMWSATALATIPEEVTTAPSSGRGEITGSCAWRSPIRTSRLSSAPRTSIRKRSSCSFPQVPTCGDREGVVGAWRQPEGHQGHGHRRVDRRFRHQADGRRRARYHHGVALRPQSRFEDEQGLRRRVQEGQQWRQSELPRGRRL